MPTPPADSGKSETSGPATTAEEAMEREGNVDGHVGESAYAPTEASGDAADE